MRKIQLEQLNTDLRQKSSELITAQIHVGREAQEAALRREATALIEKYTELVSAPAAQVDICTRQNAHSAGQVFLRRVKAIGERLHDGHDLINFVDRQSFGMWTSACETIPTADKTSEFSNGTAAPTTTPKPH
jgi:hypothetical protein